MNEHVKQILYALKRQERGLLAQAEALGMDYSAEFPAEEAERMKEAQAFIRAAPPPVVWLFSWDVRNNGQGVEIYATEAAAIEALVQALTDSYTDADMDEGDSMEQLLRDAREQKKVSLERFECWYAVDEYEVLG